MSSNSFAEIEKRTLALLNGSSSKRINARLQAALNYAVSAEMEMGIPLTHKELAEGLTQGIVAMLRNVEQNMPPGTIDLIFRKCGALLSSRHTQQPGQSIGRAVPNPHGGTA